MFGVDDLAIAGLIAMIAGTAVQYHAQSQAQARQQRVLQESLQRQRGYQQQAEQAVLDRVKDYAPEHRQQQQNEIAEQLDRDLMEPVRRAQPKQEEASAVHGEVSQDYLSARHRAQARQRESAEALAKLLGKTISAGRLRQQEGLQLADTGQSLDRLGRDAHGIAQADQVAIQEAGIPNMWQQLAGELLKGAGTMGMSGGLGGASTMASAKWALPALSAGTSLAGLQPNSLWRPHPHSRYGLQRY
jgi:hypothetical protein